MKKSFLFAFAALSVLVLTATLRHYQADLDTLRDWIAQAEVWRAERIPALALGFFAAYVVVTALSLPLASG